MALTTEALVDRFRGAINRHQPPGHREPEPTPAQVTIPLGILKRHQARIEADDITECPHIDETCAAFWLPALPNSYLCAACLTTVPVPLDCDNCAQRSAVLTRWVHHVGGRTTHLSFFCPACIAILDGDPR